MAKRHRVHAFNTEPVVNGLQHEPSAWEEYQKWMFARPTDKPSPEYVADVLGPHDYTWTGEYRFRVWERPYETLADGSILRWRLFAAKGFGLSLEYEGPYGPAKAVAATRAFIEFWRQRERDPDETKDS